MHKLTTHLRIITIGLSIFLTIPSCGLLLWDEPDDKLNLAYENKSSNTILLKFVQYNSNEFDYSWKDSLVISSSQSITQLEFVANDSDNSDNIEKAIMFYNAFSIEIFQSDSLIKVWEGPPGYYGDSIHSPFNYDSWEIVPVEDNPENIVGAVTFTITDENLK